MTARTPDLLYRLAAHDFCPVPAGTPNVEGGVDPIPGSGPYSIASHDGTLAVVVRNPNYRGPRPARYDAIAIELYRDLGAAIADVDAGALDVVLLPPGGEFDDLARTWGPDTDAARQRRPALVQRPRLVDLFPVPEPHSRPLPRPDGPSGLPARDRPRGRCRGVRRARGRTAAPAGGPGQRHGPAAARRLGARHGTRADGGSEGHGALRLRRLLRQLSPRSRRRSRHASRPSA